MTIISFHLWSLRKPICFPSELFPVPGFRFDDQATHKAVTAPTEACEWNGILGADDQLDVLWRVHPEIDLCSAPWAFPRFWWWYHQSRGCPSDQPLCTPDDPNSHCPLLLAKVRWLLHAPRFRWPRVCPLCSWLTHWTDRPSGWVSQTDASYCISTQDSTASFHVRKCVNCTL